MTQEEERVHFKTLAEILIDYGNIQVSLVSAVGFAYYMGANHKKANIKAHIMVDEQKVRFETVK